MLLKEIAEVIDVEARLGTGYEMGSMPLCEMYYLSFDGLEPEMGVLSADVWIEQPTSAEHLSVNPLFSALDG